jgi:hypothetical protein
MSGRTFSLPPGHPLPSSVTLPQEVVTLYRESETGAFLFWSQAESKLVTPPFPVERYKEQEGWHVGPMHSLLDKPRRTAVALVRLGGFAIGVFDGERLIASKVDAPFVKGRHRAGGRSSGRFARRREGQARSLYDKACETFRAVVEPHRAGLNHLVLGGDRMTLLDFEKRCGYLSGFRSIRLRRLLHVPDPRQKVLENAIQAAYMSQVVTFTPPRQAG